MLQHLKTKKKFLGSFYLSLSLLQQVNKGKKNIIRKVIGYNHRRCCRSFFLRFFSFTGNKKKGDGAQIPYVWHAKRCIQTTKHISLLSLSLKIHAGTQTKLPESRCLHKQSRSRRGRKKKQREITSAHKQVDRNPYTVVSFLSYTAVTGYKKKKATKKKDDVGSTLT